MEEITRLPKNIRQIGDKDDIYRVYIEDYVYTFIKKLINSEDLTAKAGILFGTSANFEESQCYFINGAVTIDELWSELGELQFSDEVWEHVEEVRQEYFPETKICGWFVRGSEENALDFIVLKQLHRSAFSKESLLYLCRGDDFGLWIGARDTLSAIQGYYIYYERNPQMQEYMVGQNEGEQVETEVKDEAAQNFRAVMQEKKITADNKKQAIVYRVGLAAAVVVLLLGIQAWRNRPKNSAPSELQGMESQAVEAGAIPEETSISQEDSQGLSSESLSVNQEEISEAGAEEAINHTVGDAVQAAAQPAEQAGTTIPSEVSAVMPTPQTDSSVLQETPVVKAAQVISSGGKYVVKPGDTLISICVEHYGTTQMLPKLCELNHISNANAIFVGQEIELP